VWTFQQIIRSKELKLIREIGGGPGYLLHAGQKKGDAVIVKVFNPGPDSAVRRVSEEFGNREPHLRLL
jgi:hypothetical protein